MSRILFMQSALKTKGISRARALLLIRKKNGKRLRRVRSRSRSRFLVLVLVLGPDSRKRNDGEGRHVPPFPSVFKSLSLHRQNNIRCKVRCEGTKVHRVVT